MCELSVLMSARNAEKTIGTAIRSSLRAMQADSELLVLLDDCSDATEDVVERISDSRLRIIRSNERLGIPASRNVLLEESLGKYVAVIDSDDIALPWRFSYPLRRIRDHDAIFGTAILFGPKLRPFPVRPQIPASLNPETTKLSLTVANPLVHSTATIHRSVLRKVGGYTNSIAEDFELWLRIQNSGGEIYRSGLPLIAYRYHSGQATQQTDYSALMQSDEQFQAQLVKLRQEVARYLCNQEEWTLEVDAVVRKKIHELSPWTRLEHVRAPSFVRRWQQRVMRRGRTYRE